MAVRVTTFCHQPQLHDVQASTGSAHNHPVQCTDNHDHSNDDASGINDTNNHHTIDGN